MTFDEGKSRSLYNTSVTSLTPAVIAAAKVTIDSWVPDQEGRTTICRALGIE